jgi:hypothetical protein
MPSYERTGSDLDTCQASKILNPNFLWCFRFLFPLQENNAEIQDARPSDSGIDINGCYGELANYLKGEAKCICSELFLYADFFHCGLLNRRISK